MDKKKYDDYKIESWSASERRVPYHPIIQVQINRKYAMKSTSKSSLNHERSIPTCLLCESSSHRRKVD